MKNPLLLVRNWTPGVPGGLIRLNIGTGVSIFGQNITIWHARPPKNYRFLVLPQQEKINFFIVEL